MGAIMSGNAEMLPQGGKLKPPMIVGSAMQSFLVVKNRKIHFEINEFYPFSATTIKIEGRITRKNLVHFRRNL